MVINAPQSNIISAAEHTMALLLAQARNVPQAHSALVDGRWERSKWEGVELADKHLASWVSDELASLSPTGHERFRCESWRSTRSSLKIGHSRLVLNFSLEDL